MQDIPIPQIVFTPPFRSRDSLVLARRAWSTKAKHRLLADDATTRSGALRHFTGDTVPDFFGDHDCKEEGTCSTSGTSADEVNCPLLNLEILPDSAVLSFDDVVASLDAICCDQDVEGGVDLANPGAASSAICAEEGEQINNLSGQVVVDALRQLIHVQEQASSVERNQASQSGLDLHLEKDDVGHTKSVARSRPSWRHGMYIESSTLTDSLRRLQSGLQDHD
ncbi:hypothetical protein B0H21DRAFT_465509 [Amylocystis lapponica]|nr:hypothetical protein B0H21DRAFT_465509 [Amylocystis lapponica]